MQGAKPGSSSICVPFIFFLQARQVNRASEKIDWPAIARHFGRFGVAGREGDAARKKYWEIERGDPGEGANAGKKKSYHTSTPIWLMVITALEQLGTEATSTEIVEQIEAIQAFAAELDWSVRKGFKVSPRWHENVMRNLARHPELFERAGKRINSKHGGQGSGPMLWRLAGREIVEQAKAKHGRKASVPHLGQQHR
ncbi:hypothetical protein WJX72_005732 [[Myrmecia] bisecta]|uniref:Uncharacterized protein n=1 Tax=[Myrmecia] bisecta TaxID=41462 RepID=A0AAW1PNY3_9CHLO